jgi:RNA polymerase primary sigma factor
MDVSEVYAWSCYIIGNYIIAKLKEVQMSTLTPELRAKIEKLRAELEARRLRNEDNSKKDTQKNLEKLIKIKGEIGSKLYPWQKRAYTAWENNDYCAVIEAVTGTGKSLVAYYAITNHLLETNGNGKVLIIVPNKELQRQWYKKLKELGFTDKDMVKFNGYKTDCPIRIAIVNSAAKYMLNIEPDGLLIADECHRYATQNFSDALEISYKKRLGLTATYDRDDGGTEQYLAPYFYNGICYSLSYKEALNAGIISPFEVYFIGVDLDSDKKAEYKQYEDYCRKNRYILINKHGISDETFGIFIKEVKILSKSGEYGSKIAGYYLSAFNKKQHILAGCRSKMAAVMKLRKEIEAANRTIVFTQTKEAANNVVNIVNSVTSKKASVLDSSMKTWERDRVFSDFEKEDGETVVIAAPRLLDEGIDVPSADLAIILASNRSKRQMIQRMGRVIRKKDDGRPAKIFILYVKDTSEDPNCGAYEEFLDEIIEAGDKVKVKYCA